MEKPWLQHYEEGVPPTLEYPQTTLHDMQDISAERYPDRTAAVFLGARLPYRQLADLTDRLAAALHDLGVSKGDRVSLLLPNCPQFLMAYYATLKLGAVVVATSPLYSPREAQHQLSDAGAETIIVL
ncbi:MAG: AMP-binding protein, partial [Anaerolineae bacterium]